MTWICLRGSHKDKTYFPIGSPNGGFVHWGKKTANPGERPLDFHEIPPLPIPPRIRLRREDSGVGALCVATSAEECPRIPSNIADPSIFILMYPKNKFRIKLKPKHYQIPFFLHPFPRFVTLLPSSSLRTPRFHSLFPSQHLRIM